MTLSRIELDGVGSPSALAARIHELDPDLPLDFSIEDLCRRLDIKDIEDSPVSSFAAMLLMHPDRAWGSIVVAQNTSPRRRRFSIGHELGHFLINSHRPQNGEQFACSHADLRLENTRFFEDVDVRAAAQCGDVGLIRGNRPIGGVLSSPVSTTKSS